MLDNLRFRARLCCRWSFTTMHTSGIVGFSLHTNQQFFTSCDGRSDTTRLHRWTCFTQYYDCRSVTDCRWRWGRRLVGRRNVRANTNKENRKAKRNSDRRNSKTVTGTVTYSWSVTREFIGTFRCNAGTTRTIFETSQNCKEGSRDVTRCLMSIPVTSEEWIPSSENGRNAKKKQQEESIEEERRRKKPSLPICTQNTSPDAHTRTFFSCTCHISFMRTLHGSRWKESTSFSVFHFHLFSLMSLLNVPYRPFPRVLSSPSGSLSRPSASSSSMERSCRKSPSESARWSGPGRMADPDPNTGYDPKLSNFFSYMDPEHTPINIPDIHQNFLCPDEATVIHTSPECLPNSGVSSSSKQTAASRVPSMFGPCSLWKQGACHVSGRTGLQETRAELDRESVAATIFSSQSKRKRDRDTNVAHSLKDTENLQKILERKVDSAVRGERVTQQKMYEAEAEVETRNWGHCCSRDQSRIWISAISATST